MIHVRITALGDSCCAHFGNVAVERQRALLSLSWGQGKVPIVEGFTEEVTFELGLKA